MGEQRVKMAFKPDILSISIESILSLKQVKSGLKQSIKYQRILASVREVGIIEPLIIYPNKSRSDTFFLLDGHLRLAALEDMGCKDAPCLISTDDEAFTYNHKVNRLSPIQEHYMILKAIDNGVSEERIARALNVDISSIKKKRNLLDGICPEAVELLKDKQVHRSTFTILKKMKPMRQIESAELMIASNNYSRPYASALLIATSSAEMVQPKAAMSKSVPIGDFLRIENEMKNLEKDFRSIQDDYGNTVVILTVARGYVRNVLSSDEVSAYLLKNYPEYLSGLQGVVGASSLE